MAFHLLIVDTRSHIRNIKKDDQRIMFEGIDSLTRTELQEACAERGMRALGLPKEAYKRQLQQWIDLTSNRFKLKYSARTLPLSTLK